MAGWQPEDKCNLSPQILTCNSFINFLKVLLCENLYLFFCFALMNSGVRSAMHVASQFSGRGPTDVDDAPAFESKI